MKKLGEEIKQFISTISEEEMKYNHKLRNLAIGLQEQVTKDDSKIDCYSRQEIMTYLDPDTLLRA